MLSQCQCQARRSSVSDERNALQWRSDAQDDLSPTFEHESEQSSALFEQQLNFSLAHALRKTAQFNSQIRTIQESVGRVGSGRQDRRTCTTLLFATLLCAGSSVALSVPWTVPDR